ncbi:glycosyltransferase [Entomobacter blattae]|uniref:glycosyltransferase n=1 Tax=Entomobacter blattae TaxID=2762277 RepID=UPI001EF12748|nr:glycosyltransferase [Entomobacter blattae]
MPEFFPKIAYVINSLEGGGAALPLPSLIEIMKNNGYTVEVFALTLRDGKALENIKRTGTPVHVRTGKEENNLAAFFWLYFKIKDYHPNLIWTSLTRATLLGQIVGLLCHIQVVSWQHAGYLKPANLTLLRLLKRIPALWIGDSQAITDLTHKRLAIPKNKLVTWPIFKANPAAPLASPWEKGQVVRIGSLGRLHPVKGYNILLEALALLLDSQDIWHEFQLTICGEGDERVSLQNRINTLKSSLSKPFHITLLPFTPQPEEFLSTLHVYVQPSRSEGFCVAAHEAMQAGLPVIASQVGQLAYSVKNGETGYLVPPGDAQALAKVLLNILSDPSSLATMGRKAREEILTAYSAENFEKTGNQILSRLGPLLS